jgi:dihydroorotase
MAGINKGLIKQGFDADFVIVDTNRNSKIDVSGFASKGKNTPFDGENVFGEVLMTAKKGIVVYKTKGMI